MLVTMKTPTKTLTREYDSLVAKVVGLHYKQQGLRSFHYGMRMQLWLLKQRMVKR